MESRSDNHGQDVTNLVTYLYARRETILNNWRTACEHDPTLGKISALSREEFNNLMPIILDILEQQLLGKEPDTDVSVAAGSHGLHRWQKSHGLPELLKELSHLSVCLFEEVKLFRRLYPQTDPDMLLLAQRHILQLMNQTAGASVGKHDELQRLEAAGRAASLQHALDQMEQSFRQRGDLLRSSSHDLRSSFGVIQSAAHLLNLENTSEEEKAQYLEMLTRNLSNVHGMLSQLMDLARLEAGQEPVALEEFDAARLLNELVNAAQPLAGQRGLVLQGEGPGPLLVKTDRIKIYRIAQNLLINALTYTQTGIVSVSWSTENDFRWVFSIQDSGPGLPPGLVDLLHTQLKPTVEMTSVLGPEQGQPTPVEPDRKHEIPDGRSLADAARPEGRGEGVGLQIVKRLCEMIGATLEVESRAGRGTLFRIRMLIQPAT